MNKPRHQMGVALLSVLMITALVVLVVSNILARQRFNLHSSANLQTQQTLWQLALSGEVLAQQRLLEDARSEGGLLMTHLGQKWAQNAPVLDIDGAIIHVRLEDLSARLNLNSLSQGNNRTQRARYQRLLAQQGISAHDPAILFNQSSSNRLGDISELRQLPHVNRTALQQLTPLVAAFDTSSININTAPAEILACIEGIDPATARTLAKSRPAKGYPSLEAFLSNPMLQGRDINPSGLGVSSRQFRATVTVDSQQQRLSLVSDLSLIDNHTVQVRQRTLLRAPAVTNPQADKPK
ncbi:type II secretion system minor pseudopilin GspK [Ectopseudomonas mendocina]|uniref:Type II secretion system protein K n=1 Tax=Ectopseudomonas mendocina TaxID=300 RepID=A0ABZ2RIW3_ECTME